MLGENESVELTLPGVIASARQAIKEKRLQLFSLKYNPSDTARCRYRSEVDGKVYCCVIGSAIPDDKYDPVVMDAQGNGHYHDTSIHTLLHQDSDEGERSIHPAPVFTCPESEDWLAELQAYHDELAGDIVAGRKTQEEAVACLVERLDELEGT